MGEKEVLKDKIKDIEAELVMHGYLDGWNIQFLKNMLTKLKTKLNKLKGND